jgi:UDPglucose--hexose-1-phosphate uridylyltransferase
MIHQEYEDKERIVAENDDFISFCPFVPRYPFECWILPKKHLARFSVLSEEGKGSLARILKEILSRIKVCLSNPSYNFYLHISPVNSESQESFHWHIEIVPKLTRVAGFEWGTGFYTVKTEPGKAAEFLRKVEI